MKYGPRISKPAPVLVVAAIILAGIILIAIVIAAGASPSCMTQAEARVKFPRAHLYWHTLHHCWDDRGRAARKTDRRPIIIDANGNRPALVNVRWYTRPFNAVDQLNPPVVLSVIEHRWPGSYIMDAPVVVIEPITVVAAAQFNELDEGADR